MKKIYLGVRRPVRKHKNLEEDLKETPKLNSEIPKTFYQRWHVPDYISLYERIRD